MSACVGLLLHNNPHCQVEEERPGRAALAHEAEATVCHLHYHQKAVSLLSKSQHMIKPAHQMQTN